MTTTSSKTLRDPRDVLRGAVARVEEELAMVGCVPALRAAWSALVDTLALGPAPQLRECPSCGAIGMLAATRCGHCWIVLSPPVSAG